jgi:hypothetical protein
MRKTMLKEGDEEGEHNRKPRCRSRDDREYSKEAESTTNDRLRNYQSVDPEASGEDIIDLVRSVRAGREVPKFSQHSLGKRQNKQTKIKKGIKYLLFQSHDNFNRCYSVAERLLLLGTSPRTWGI